MKILKNSLQKNAVVNKSMYTKDEIRDLLYQGRVFYIDENGIVSQDENNYKDEYELRVSLTVSKEIKVIHHNFLQMYMAVVVQSDDTRIFIEL